MRTRSIVVAALLIGLFASAIPTQAAADKELQNSKGSVSYQTSSGKPTPLAPNAVVSLADKDYAITGDESLATVGLPDSSRVLVGSQSKVQLAFFNQAAATNAKFLVFNGKVRFIVQHPQGAKANYTFQTATGSVAVRGTEGDIDINGNSLQVNVYEVCDASEPVVVTTRDGQSFKLTPGHSLVANLVNGIVQAQIQTLTQQMIDQFSPDFGVPASWDAAKGQIVGYATGQASSAIDNATGGYGSQVVGAVSGLFGHHKATPSPSPSPASESCSHQ
jgi:FecR protein